MLSEVIMRVPQVREANLGIAQSATTNSESQSDEPESS